MHRQAMGARLCHTLYDVSPATPLAGATPPWSAQTLGDALTAFGPLMMSVEFNAVAGHWILLTGIQGNVVFHHDPWRGMLAKTCGQSRLPG